MPLINIIRGESVPTAPLNVRTPVVKLPLWMIITWQVIKSLVWLVVTYFRHWYVTLPVTGLTWLYVRYDWQGLAVLATAIVVPSTAWYFLHRASWQRFGWWPILARCRRFVYRRRWMAAMVTAKLAISYDKRSTRGQA